eukprot:TRINITY_DN171_c0_g2_i10.p1 TRINITY_DN171_c0_g2~~TRINITY_DN171_c0_g2_i10.p1  ORF type:complete len:238 (+),score=44.22 TRINITY_DN171_c0_g2_i10:453-1166(+)
MYRKHYQSSSSTITDKQPASLITRSRIDIIIELTRGKVKKEEDLVRNMEAEYTEDGSLILESIISRLKGMGYFLSGAAISYYSQSCDNYVFCALDPVPENVFIDSEDCPAHSVLKIRANLNPETCELADNLDAKREVNGKRKPAERKIGYVIRKVMEWRRWCAGVIDNNGLILKFSREEAADKVGLSKKSLDEYHWQIKIGEEYGFDFEKEKDKKFGVLRAFVKDQERRKKFEVECI